MGAAPARSGVAARDAAGGPRRRASRHPDDRVVELALDGSSTITGSASAYFSRRSASIGPAGNRGLPDPTKLQSFVGVDSAGGAAGHPVDLKIGPSGDLFYVDMDDGTLHRVSYTATNQPPTARVTANPTNGPTPRSTSTPPGRQTGGSAAELLVGSQRRRDVRGRERLDGVLHLHGRRVYHPSVRVTEDKGASDTASVSIMAGNTAPTAMIDAPSSSLIWKVGDTIGFSGHATDAQDGALPSSGMSWSVIMHHCFTPTDCHNHVVQTFNGVSSGSFSAPDHATRAGSRFNSPRPTRAGCPPRRASESIPRRWC
jgi:hypothetical protein